MQVRKVSINRVVGLLDLYYPGGLQATNMSKASNFVFTWNNYPDDYEQKLKAFFDENYCRFIAWSEEIGDKCKTPHLQAFMGFPEQVPVLKTRKKAYKAWGIAYCAPMIGSIDQSEVYCTKKASLKVIGELPSSPAERAAMGGQVTKIRLQEAWILAKEGRIDEIPEAFRWRYYKTIKQIYVDYMPKGERVYERKRNVFLWGPTRTNKTRWVHAQHEEGRVYDKPLNKWWDGYDPRRYDAAIINELAPENTKYLTQLLKKWMDIYLVTLEIKGGTISVYPPKIYITSNFPLEDLFPDKRDREAIRSRLCTVMHVLTPLPVK